MPVISSAVYRKFEKRIVLAYLNVKEPGEIVEVHDYTVCASAGTDTIYRIAKPFSTGYLVGGIQLDELGKRIVVVSADGFYIYLYSLEQKLEVAAEEESQEG